MTPAALTNDAIKTKEPGGCGQVWSWLSLTPCWGLHLGTAGWYLLKRQILMFWAPSHILSYHRRWNTWNLTSDADKVSVDTLLCSHSVVSNSLQPHGLQHTRPPCPSPTPGVYPNSCPLSRWCHPTISSSVSPPPALNLSQHRGLFKWVSSSRQVAKVLEFQLQHQSFQWTPRTDLLYDGLVGFPCSPRDSQESSCNYQSWHY